MAKKTFPGLRAPKPLARKAEDPVSAVFKESMEVCDLRHDNGTDEHRKCFDKTFAKKYKKALSMQKRRRFNVRCVDEGGDTVFTLEADDKKSAVLAAEENVRSGRVSCVIAPPAPAPGKRGKKPLIIKSPELIRITKPKAPRPGDIPPPVEPAPVPEPEPAAEVEEEEDDYGPHPDGGAPVPDAAPRPPPPPPPPPAPRAATADYLFHVFNTNTQSDSRGHKSYVSDTSAKTAAKNMIDVNEVILVTDGGETRFVALIAEANADLDMLGRGPILRLLAKVGKRVEDLDSYIEIVGEVIGEGEQEDLFTQPPRATATRPAETEEEEEEEQEADANARVIRFPDGVNWGYWMSDSRKASMEFSGYLPQARNLADAAAYLYSKLEQYPDWCGFVFSRSKEITKIVSGNMAAETQSWFERIHSDLIKFENYKLVKIPASAKELAEAITRAMGIDADEPPVTAPSSPKAPEPPPPPPAPPAPTQITPGVAAQAAASTGNAALDQSINELDADQKAVALTNPTGVLRVLAGAGGGKTKTLVTQVARLIKQGVYKPEEVMLTTFTNRAGAELKERIGKFLTPDEMNRMLIGTFDSLTLKLLANAGVTMAGLNIDKMGTKPPQARPGTWELNQLQRAILYGGGGPAMSGKKPPYGVLKGLSFGSMRLAKAIKQGPNSQNVNAWGAMKAAWTLIDSLDIDPKDPDLRSKLDEFMKEFAKVEGEIPNMLAFNDPERRGGLIKLSFRDGFEKWYRLMHQAMRELNYWTYGDAKRKLLRQLKSGATLPTKIVFVDEAQDNARVQLEIAKVMAKDALVLIGDGRQVIYTWRGAYADLFLHADKLLGATTMEIRSNYRSGSRIVLTGNKVADGRSWNLGASQVPMRKENGQPFAGEVELWSTEGTDKDKSALALQNVALNIEEKLRGGEKLATAGKPNFCVLVKKNQEALILQGFLASRKIPAIMAGKGNFFELAEIKLYWGVLALIEGKPNLVNIPEIAENLLSAAGLDELYFRNYNDKLAIIQNFAEFLKNREFYAALAAIETVIMRAAGKRLDTLASWRTLLSAYLATPEANASFGNYAKEVVSIIASNVAYYGALVSDDERSGDAGGDKAVPPLAEAFIKICESYKDIDELVAFIKQSKRLVDYVDLEEGTDPLPENGVYVSTIWKAKGLEWKNTYVFAPQVEAPFRRSPEQQEEEVRVFYVAVTRARDRLVVIDPPIDLSQFAGEGPIAGATEIMAEPLPNVLPTAEESAEELATQAEEAADDVSRDVIEWERWICTMLDDLLINANRPAENVSDFKERQANYENQTEFARYLLTESVEQFTRLASDQSEGPSLFQQDYRTARALFNNVVRLYEKRFVIPFAKPPAPAEWGPRKSFVHGDEYNPAEAMTCYRLVEAFVVDHPNRAKAYAGMLQTFVRQSAEIYRNSNKSATHQALYNNIQRTADLWKDLIEKHAEVIEEAPRLPSAQEPLAVVPTAQTLLNNDAATIRVGLVACAKTKQEAATTAAMLYKGDLFQRSLKFAQATCDVVYILSAKYGLLQLNTVIEPYDVYLGDLTSDQRNVWGKKIVSDLSGLFPGRNMELVFFSGEEYLKAVKEHKTEFMEYETAFGAMQIGERKQFLKQLDALIDLFPTELAYLEKVLPTLPKTPSGIVKMLNMADGPGDSFPRELPFNDVRLLRLISMPDRMPPTFIYPLRGWTKAMLRKAKRQDLVIPYIAFLTNVEYRLVSENVSTANTAWDYLTDDLVMHLRWDYDLTEEQLIWLTPSEMEEQADDQAKYYAEAAESRSAGDDKSAERVWKFAFEAAGKTPEYSKADTLENTVLLLDDRVRGEERPHGWFIYSPQLKKLSPIMGTIDQNTLTGYFRDSYNGMVRMRFTSDFEIPNALALRSAMARTEEKVQTTQDVTKRIEQWIAKTGSMEGFVLTTPSAQMMSSVVDNVQFRVKSLDEARVVLGEHLLNTLTPTGFGVGIVRFDGDELTLFGVFRGGFRPGMSAPDSKMYERYTACNEEKSLYTEVGFKSYLAKLPKPATRTESPAEAQPSLPQAPLTPRGRADDRPKTRVVTVTNRIGDPATYAVVEADFLQPSHDPITFKKNPKYPEGVQERDYDTNENEQKKVFQNAQQLNPDIVLTDNPDAVNGPPIITNDGIVLGGNGRTMMIKRAYAENMASADNYRFELEQRSDRVFNIAPRNVRALKQPVLVRVLPISAFAFANEKQQLINLVRIYNEGMTSALTETERGVAMAKQLDDDAVAAIGMIFADSDDTLRTLMKTRAQAFITALENANIITDANRATYVSRDGKLTDTAKNAIEAAFQGRVLETTTRIKQTGPLLIAKIERITPSLVKVDAINKEFTLMKEVREAVDLLNAVQRVGSDGVDSYIAMRENEPEFAVMDKFVRPSDLVISMAQLIEDNGQRALQARFKAWAQLASFNPRMKPLFGKNPTVGEAMETLFAEPDEELSGVLKIRRKKTGQTEVLR